MWAFENNCLVFSSENTYNFSDLDAFLDELTTNGLYPRFELMGLPLNETEKNRPDFWFNLTAEIAVRYLSKRCYIKVERKLTKFISDRYGPNELKKWRFETWNEPDLKTYNLLNFSLPGKLLKSNETGVKEPNYQITLLDYLSYAKACSDGLKFAFRNINHRPKFGGPAGLFRNPSKHPLCWGLLEQCQKSAKDCPLDYISFHRKGGGKAAEVVEETVELVEEIRTRFKPLKRLPVANE